MHCSNMGLNKISGRICGGPMWKFFQHGTPPTQPDILFSPMFEQSYLQQVQTLLKSEILETNDHLLNPEDSQLLVLHKDDGPQLKDNILDTLKSEDFKN
jgi:hypothetical protein